MDDDEDETFSLTEDEIWTAAGSFPCRRSGWIYAGHFAGFFKEVSLAVSHLFRALETVFDQRGNWEEERQEFSDSVKQDFLAIDTFNVDLGPNPLKEKDASSE